jgi:outer membrane immunogenic protein
MPAGWNLAFREQVVAISLIVSVAFTAVCDAADLEPAQIRSTAPFYSSQPVQNWSGFSIGVIGGGGLGEAGQTLTDGSFSTRSYKVTGGLIGVHSELDYQSGNWVWGLAADAEWASINGAVDRTPPGGLLSTYSTRLGWLASSYVRVGYSFDKWLPYITAGPAVGSVSVKGTFPALGAVSQNDTWLGWSLGFGVDYAITPNLIAKAEYMYVCLGQSLQFSVDNAEFMTHLVRLGLSYKLDWNGLQSPANPTGSLPAKQVSPNSSYDWTGFYVGFNLGGLTGKIHYEYALKTWAPFGNLKGLVGTQAGYNLQRGNIVVGVESDLQVTGQSFQTPLGGLNAAVTTKQEVPVFLTFRGRAGLAMDRWLFYGTGGLAYGEVRSSTTITVPGAGTLTPGFVESRPGWTVGAGVEAPVWNGWTAKFEYLFVDLGAINQNIAGIGSFAPLNISSVVQDHSLRIGLNYAVK